MTNTNKNVKYYKYTKKKDIPKKALHHTTKIKTNVKKNTKDNTKDNTNDNTKDNTKTNNNTIKQNSKLQSKKHKSHNINDDLKFILEEAHSVTLGELNKYKLSYFKDQQCILDNINKLYKS